MEKENIDICLNCKLPTCDENDPRCPFFAGETAQNRYYRRLTACPERLAVMRKKWNENYQRKKAKRIHDEL